MGQEGDEKGVEIKKEGAISKRQKGTWAEIKERAREIWKGGCKGIVREMKEM